MSAEGLFHHVSTWSLSSALTGDDTMPLPAWERIVRAGVALLVPVMELALPAAVVAGTLIAWPCLRRKAPGAERPREG